MGTALIDHPVDYDGSQLRSHFVRESAGIKGDGIVAFSGSCYVRGENLVDLEDAEAGSSIVAGEMLHFICEHFQCPLKEMNYRLRLFIAIMKDILLELVPGMTINREGDDLYIDNRKMTVAISTISSVSALFHCGVNIDPEGAPVPAVGLKELGVDAFEFTRLVMERYGSECESVELAIRKVKGV